MRHRVDFTPDAVRHFKRLSQAVRPLIKDAVKAQLIESDPEETTRNAKGHWAAGLPAGGMTAYPGEPWSEIRGFRRPFTARACSSKARS